MAFIANLMESDVDFTTRDLRGALLYVLRGLNLRAPGVQIYRPVSKRQHHVGAGALMRRKACGRRHTYSAARNDGEMRAAGADEITLGEQAHFA